MFPEILSRSKSSRLNSIHNLANKLKTCPISGSKFRILCKLIANFPLLKVELFCFS